MFKQEFASYAFNIALVDSFILWKVWAVAFTGGATSHVGFVCPWGTRVLVIIPVSVANYCEPGVGETVVLGFTLGLVWVVMEEDNMVVERTIGGFSGETIVVALVVAIIITIPGTYYFAVMIWTAHVASIPVSRVLL